ncbi:hypothetical protein ACX80O_02400 [Arthrobacter sp. Hz1]
MRLKRPRINGYRGTFQLLFAGAYIFIGRSYLKPPGPDRENTLHWFTELLPMSALGWMWISCAVIGILGAFASRPADAVSFAALCFAPMALCVLNTIGWLTGYNSSGWEVASIYLFFSGVPFVVAAMQADKDRDKRAVTL